MRKLAEVVWQASAKQTSVAILSMSPPGTPCKLLAQFQSESIPIGYDPKSLQCDTNPYALSGLLLGHLRWDLQG